MLNRNVALPALLPSVTVPVFLKMVVSSKVLLPPVSAIVYDFAAVIRSLTWTLPLKLALLLLPASMVNVFPVPVTVSPKLIAPPAVVIEVSSVRVTGRDPAAKPEAVVVNAPARLSAAVPEMLRPPVKVKVSPVASPSVMMPVFRNSTESVKVLVLPVRLTV